MDDSSNSALIVEQLKKKLREYGAFTKGRKKDLISQFPQNTMYTDTTNGIFA
jgi:hypothetical protein